MNTIFFSIIKYAKVLKLKYQCYKERLIMQRQMNYLIHRIFKNKVCLY